MIDPKVVRPMNVFLAVDGSQHSMAAVDLVHDLPLPPDSRITVLAVLPIQHTVSRATLMAALDQSKELLIDKHSPVETGLLHGHPARALTDFASDHHPDLIVMGAKGLRATLGILLGGVAQQMVEYSHWPVLVVRLPYNGLQRILLVTDGSPFSRLAVDFTGCFPIPQRAELKIVHVLTPQHISDLPAGEAKTEQELAWQNEERCHGEEVLEQALSALKSMQVEASGELLRGDAATEIIHYAENNRIDLIIAGSRGLSQVRGWLLGSVSRKLVHYADCSVLIVKNHPDQI